MFVCLFICPLWKEVIAKPPISLQAYPKQQWLSSPLSRFLPVSPSNCPWMRRECLAYRIQFRRKPPKLFACFVTTRVMTGMLPGSLLGPSAEEWFTIRAFRGCSRCTGLGARHSALLSFFISQQPWRGVCVCVCHQLPFPRATSQPHR